MIDNKECERSIIKKYRKEIWRKFIRAISDYALVEDGDKIMVCISGGKDSFIMAKCFQESKKHGKINFDVHFVCMDPGYNEINRQKIENNASSLAIPLEIFESDIFSVVDHVAEKSPCYLCARMRRGHLYNRAKQLGCNKIALGHHFDDVIETTLLSMFYGAEVKTMLPKIHSDNFEGLSLIRPLCLIKEKDIISWRNYNNLEFINCACKFTEKTALENDNSSKRKEIKELIETLRKTHKKVDENIFTALTNVNLNCVYGYKLDKEETTFLDIYNDSL